MKGIVKGLIIGIIIVIIGAAILITGLALSGWKISGTEFEVKTFTAENENDALNIEIGAGTLDCEFYDGDKVIIDYPVAKNYVTEVRENDGCVYLKSKFKWHVFLESYEIPNTIVKLPKDTVFKMDIKISAGTATLADGVYSKVSIDMSAGTLKANEIQCTSLNCDLSAGTLKISSAVCNTLDCHLSAGTLKIDKTTADNAKISLSAGSAKLGFAGDKSEYGITSKVSAGSCNVSAQSGTTEKTIDVKVSAGSVNLDFNV